MPAFTIHVIHSYAFHSITVVYNNHFNWNGTQMLSYPNAALVPHRLTLV